MVTITITIREFAPNCISTFSDPVRKDASELETLAGELYLRRITETMEELKKHSDSKFSLDAEGDSATRLNRKFNPPE